MRNWDCTKARRYPSLSAVTEFCVAKMNRCLLEITQVDKGPGAYGADI